MPRALAFISLRPSHEASDDDVTRQSAPYRLLRPTALGFALIVLAGCASQLSNLPVVGVPANAPARPEGPAVYPAVHDLPPPRDQAVLEPDERDKIQKELITARDRQTKSGGSQDAADTPKSAKKKPAQAH